MAAAEAAEISERSADRGRFRARRAHATRPVVATGLKDFQNVAAMLPHGGVSDTKSLKSQDSS
jgi:hypothetical protein